MRGRGRLDRSLFSPPPDRFAAARTARTSVSRWSVTRFPFGKLTKMLSLGCGDLGEARCSDGQACAQTWRTVSGAEADVGQKAKQSSPCDRTQKVRGRALDWRRRAREGSRLSGYGRSMGTGGTDCGRRTSRIVPPSISATATTTTRERGVVQGAKIYSILAAGICSHTQSSCCRFRDVRD